MRQVFRYLLRVCFPWAAWDLLYICFFLLSIFTCFLFAISTNGFIHNLKTWHHLHSCIDFNSIWTYICTAYSIHSAIKTLLLFDTYASFAWSYTSQSQFFTISLCVRSSKHFHRTHNSYIISKSNYSRNSKNRREITSRCDLRAKATLKNASNFDVPLINGWRRGKDETSTPPRRSLLEPPSITINKRLLLCHRLL